MNIKASISISRITNYGEPKPIVIYVEDETSGCQFLELRLSLADYGLLVSGLSGVECDGRVWLDAPIGKQRQVKEELVGWSNCYFSTTEKREEVARAALAPYEIDGWEGRMSDLFNHHRRSKIVNKAGEESYKVVFIRFVDAPEEV